MTTILNGPPVVTRTETTFTMDIPSAAVGKAAIRFNRRTCVPFPDDDSDAWMKLVRDLALPHIPPEPWTGPMAGSVISIVVPPASWSHAKRARALLGELRPTSAPDADNISKGIWDALQVRRVKRRKGESERTYEARVAEGRRAVIENDSAIVSLNVQKYYGECDRTLVCLTRLRVDGSVTPTQTTLGLDAVRSK